MKLHYDAATDSPHIDLADRPCVDSENASERAPNSLPAKLKTIAAA